MHGTFSAGLITGWEASTILPLQTGPPFTVTASTDISDTGGANRAAFGIALPAGTYSYGNVGRNTLRADGTQNVDIGLFRKFILSERAALQFRPEVFNVLNHANFGLPGK